jgi:hypothetical protein
METVFRMHLPARTLVQENTFDARRDADCLKFRVAKGHDLPLRVYVQRKVMLLQDANITEEQEIVRLVWKGFRVYGTPYFTVEVKKYGKPTSRT